MRASMLWSGPLAARRFYSVNWLEPLTTLAVAAGATERVRLGTSILIMPLRNPVILAKELATLQFLSDNRVILGAGVGWNDAEYEAVRSYGARFIVADGHQLDEIERVVAGNGHFVVVEKVGEAGALASRDDPRRQ